jgi:PTH1 family peptidyl-tRNA hydrolase
MLLKPSTYMNRSGSAVAAVVSYFKLKPDQLLVVHDELDLAPGVARLKSGGGHGGHNGLKDILAHLGTADFLRLRLGIGHPGDRARVADYVLDAPNGVDGALIDEAIQRGLLELEDIVRGETARAMNRLNASR